MKKLLNCDVIIIGGGPAGLSAAINTASEGLCTVLCDSTSKGFGGQAGRSSLIENFFGFPEGISGIEMTDRAVAQARKFNTIFLSLFNAISIVRVEDNFLQVINDDEEYILGKVVLLSIGIAYKKLDCMGINEFIGRGVHYGSPSMVDNFAGRTVMIVGGANSAGQAAMYLSKCPTCKVILLIRSNSINDKMSTYLSERITSPDSPIEVITNSEISEVKGFLTLNSVVIKDRIEDSTREITVDSLYILIGAQPKTSWLRNIVNLDENGFIITGNNICGQNNGLFSMETSTGIFAAGDVRLGSVKRVAAAVGEGARAVNDIHQYLATMNNLLAIKDTETKRLAVQG